MPTSLVAEFSNASPGSGRGWTSIPGCAYFVGWNGAGARCRRSSGHELARRRRLGTREPRTRTSTLGHCRQLGDAGRLVNPAGCGRPLDDLLARHDQPDRDREPSEPASAQALEWTERHQASVSGVRGAGTARRRDRAASSFDAHHFESGRFELPSSAADDATPRTPRHRGVVLFGQTDGGAVPRAGSRDILGLTESGGNAARRCGRPGRSRAVVQRRRHLEDAGQQIVGNRASSGYRPR